jgi:hypothetical protein
MNKEIEFALNELAIDSMGIYPQATIDENNVRTERTEWQNGWNAAIIEFRQRACIFEKWFSELPEDVSAMIGEMLPDETIRLSLDKDKNVKMWVLMNDTFYFACADGEDITMEEIPLLYQVWKKFSWYGLVAIVSKKRKHLPLQAVQTEEFHEAMKYIT